MLMKYLPTETKFDFMSVRFICFAVSALALVVSAFLIPSKGLNLGIDFAGGTLVEISEPTGADTAAIRNAISALNLKDPQVTSATGTGTEGHDIFVIRAATVDAGDSITVEGDVAGEADLIIQQLEKAFPLGDGAQPDWQVLRKENVGPKVSGELFQAGITALGVSLLFMMGYIWFRFDSWQFSLGAVIALAHDVFLTIGVFSFLQIDFNLTTIAALLTIIGYSMNDTVVVFDRVREELRKYKKMPLKDVINLSLNRTLTRTTLTSGTTLLALASIYILGGEVLRGFSFALIWGIVVGTYSSIFVASALLLHMGLRRDKQPIPEAEESFS